VMLVYVSRGHQGSLRSQAGQLGAGQYAPKNTRIRNHETKRVTKNEQASSSTTTKHSQHPIGEINKPLEGDPDVVLPEDENSQEYKDAVKLKYGYIGQIGDALGLVYLYMNAWEFAVDRERIDTANAVRGGEWPWSQLPGCRNIEYNLLGGPPVEGTLDDPLGKGSENLLKTLNDLANASDADWPPREADVSYSGSSSAEKGTTGVSKGIDETLGSYGADY
ncbi:MAG TPA: hypothetical protein PL125_07240, partial [Candidatus Omnitrophota bacterium]|nr:hypothetical protein [Candidatus Omnitrophota bacterium]